MMSPFLQPAKLIIEILSMTRVLVNIPLSSDIYIDYTNVTRCNELHEEREKLSFLSCKIYAMNDISRYSVKSQFNAILHFVHKSNMHKSSF